MKKLTFNLVIVFSGFILLFTLEAKAQRSTAIQKEINLLSKSVISFNGKAQNNTISLTWGTLSETDNESFNIQRSKNCLDWENIGSIKGTGGSLWAISYCWVDTNVSEAIYFYRLQVNKNALLEYSKSISVKFNSFPEGKNRFEIYPNPTKNAIWIRSEEPINNENIFNLEVYNIKGEQIYNTKLHDNLQKVDLSDYKNGYYYIKIGTETHRIYKE